MSTTPQSRFSCYPTFAGSSVWAVYDSQQPEKPVVEFCSKPQARKIRDLLNSASELSAEKFALAPSERNQISEVLLSLVSNL